MSLSFVGKKNFCAIDVPNRNVFILFGIHAGAGITGIKSSDSLWAAGTESELMVLIVIKKGRKNGISGCSGPKLNV